eukprot:CAMPEP_0178434494 /NCGR_PEP_ID=MMETSP0689_2-20121128/33452_1 /TAXON_ID=160604 /ORGANISM="Amphidinium massartii, Strain CS-259" /LENGTH=533 /DNA_ID=CAMNT_0020056559 /DNA_START=97 /DNA_END=1695 /DNA_ORIENTATION=-
MSGANMRDLLDQLQQPKVKWSLVVVGVAVLLRLKLFLFALALPVMAFYYTPSGDASQEQAQEGTSSPAAPSPEDGEDDDDDLDADFDTRQRSDPLGLDGDEDGDPYDQSFWGADSKTPAKMTTSFTEDDDSGDDGVAHKAEDSAGGTASRNPAAPLLAKPLSAPWDDEPVVGLGDGLDTFPSESRRPLGGDLGGIGGPGGLGGHAREEMSFDFLGGGRDDEDMMGFGDSFGGKGKGKGKGKKGDKGDKGGKGDKGPSEANPRQVFVAGVADMPEDDIRTFFEEVGEVDRLKILRNPDGTSKGVCFVTFRTEDQANRALTMHGTDIGGKNLVVRHANAAGGSGQPKGDSFNSKGEGRGRFDRPRDREDGMMTSSRGPPDFGASERFSAAFGEEPQHRGHTGNASSTGPGKGGGRKGGGGRGPGRDRAEMDDLLEQALAEAPGPVRASDFDFPCRRFLSELRARDRAEGTTRFQDAIDMVSKYTITKDRSAVRKWPAYIFMLLQKFDPTLWDEVRERDAERRHPSNSTAGGDTRP